MRVLGFACYRNTKWRRRRRSRCRSTLSYVSLETLLQSCEQYSAAKRVSDICFFVVVAIRPQACSGWILTTKYKLRKGNTTTNTADTITFTSSGWLRTDRMTIWSVVMKIYSRNHIWVDIPRLIYAPYIISLDKWKIMVRQEKQPIRNRTAVATKLPNGADWIWLTSKTIVGGWEYGMHPFMDMSNNTMGNMQ